MLQWLLEVVATIPEVTVVGIVMIGQVAVAIGWGCCGTLCIPRDIRSHDFPKCDSSLGRSLQRQRILNQAIAVDARVSGLESLFVRLILVECR